jgi:hypothetical protein
MLPCRITNSAGRKKIKKKICFHKFILLLQNENRESYYFFATYTVRISEDYVEYCIDIHCISDIDIFGAQGVQTDYYPV